MGKAQRVRIRAWVFGLTPICFGLYLFVHDCLIFVHVLPPYGDGPAGIIAGPVLIGTGAALLRRLYYLPDQD